jgi:hypothetical protein
VKGYFKLRIPILVLLAALAVFIASPYLVKPRTTTSLNTCLFNRMWIETAKARWASAEAKAPSDSPTADELLPYLVKVIPMWDGQTSSPRLPTVFPTCTVTDEPYVLGDVATRIQCPTASRGLASHAWSESEYRYHYGLR